MQRGMNTNKNALASAKYFAGTRALTPAVPPGLTPKASSQCALVMRRILITENPFPSHLLNLSGCSDCPPKIHWAMSFVPHLHQRRLSETNQHCLLTSWSTVYTFIAYLLFLVNQHIEKFVINFARRCPGDWPERPEYA